MWCKYRIIYTSSVVIFMSDEIKCSFQWGKTELNIITIYTPEKEISHAIIMLWKILVLSCTM